MLNLLDTAIDLDRLWQIAARLVSIESVKDVREFADKIQEAADIVTKAGLRIAGLQSRDFMTEKQAAHVQEACNLYQKAQHA